MSTSVSFNGSSYSVPAVGEENWGGSSGVDGLLVSLANNALSKAGGTFVLTSEVDFGGTAGLKALYLKSRGSNVASSGVIRLANAESILWRNNANNANIGLSVNSSDQLTFNGTAVYTSGGSVAVTAGGTGIASYTVGDILYATDTDELSKLAIGSANTVLASGGSAPSWRTIVNADVNASAAIARTKLASGTASHVIINDGSGVMSSEATLSKARGGAGADMSSVTFPTTGTLVTRDATETLTGKTVSSTGNTLQIYDPNYLNNIGIVAATTTNANDSIKIQGAAATLSASNVLSVVLGNDASAGQLELLTATADVTLNLTGAHSGLGTLGDATRIWTIYAINDAGLKWGASLSSNLSAIADTNTSTTASSVNAATKMLVNSALNSGTFPCRPVGYVTASFDDTGGAAEDLWAVSTTAGTYGVGRLAPQQTNWTSDTVTGSWSSNTTYACYKKRIGDYMYYDVTVNTSGTPTTSGLTINLPSGDIIDVDKISRNADTQANCGVGNIRDAGTASYPAIVRYATRTSVSVHYTDDGPAGVTTSSVTESNPFAFGANDYVILQFALPLVGWST